MHAARVEIGRRLAKEHPVEADLVIPVPESGTPAAVGYAEASGIPYGLGPGQELLRRPHVHPAVARRSGSSGIRLKLNPLRDVIRGKRLVVVDDSIVRGNTQRALIRMLREAGALEVHVRIASPPVKWPCFYGIDFASRAELIANGLDVDGVRRLDQRRLARLRLRAGPDRRDRAAGQPAVHRLLHRPVPDPARRVGAARQARARGHRATGAGHRLDRSAGRQRRCVPGGAEDALTRP